MMEFKTEKKAKKKPSKKVLMKTVSLSDGAYWKASRGDVEVYLVRISREGAMTFPVDSEALTALGFQVNEAGQIAHFERD